MNLTTPRAPFRFGAQGWGATDGADWLAKARRAEALGYATFVVPDHFVRRLGPMAALAAAAAATTTLRVGTFVASNDFRHPVVLAQEAATIDLLSGGRFELGIGAGWLRSEYEAAGIPFDPPEVRVARLAESVRLLKRLFAEEAVTSTGDHYRTTDLAIVPKPVQRPHPPILIGGGGRRVLELAAREADIVGLAPRSRADGTLDPTDITLEATARKVRWVRDAAGIRFDGLELNVFVYAVEITDDRTTAATRLAPDFDLPPAALIASPHTLIGSVDEIVAAMQARREQFGLSYVIVPENLMDTLAPLIPRLAGQ